MIEDIEKLNATLDVLTRRKGLRSLRNKNKPKRQFL